MGVLLQGFVKLRCHPAGQGSGRSLAISTGQIYLPATQSKLSA